jgi:Zn-dependent metalloprotease
MSADQRHRRCTIASSDLLSHVILSGTAEQRDAALATIGASAALRTQRTMVGRLRRDYGNEIANAVAGVTLAAERRQTVFDNKNLGRINLPGTRVRGDDDPPASDDAVNQAFDGAAATWDFYQRILGRDSLDDAGMELVSSVHYGVDFDNAFWNGAQMVYGDGSGRIFEVGGLTRAIDVIGHELTHGVTEFTAGLVYSKQSGALNEHFSDVFGSLVKQWHLSQTAAQADWLIGAGTLVESLGQALRSMKEPGTAYSGDRQPAHMSDYVDLPDDNNPRNDNGGVHINSGIPNKAFYLAATALGGSAWETAGPIWYETLTSRLGENSQFSDMAAATVAVAGERYDSGVQETVQDAWAQVGLG